MSCPSEGRDGTGKLNLFFLPSLTRASLSTPLSRFPLPFLSFYQRLVCLSAHKENCLTTSPTSFLFFCFDSSAKTAVDMALISAKTILTSLSLFHITLGFFFLTNPGTIADQALVYIVGEAMGMVSSFFFFYSPYPVELNPLVAITHNVTIDDETNASNISIALRSTLRITIPCPGLSSFCPCFSRNIRFTHPQSP